MKKVKKAESGMVVQVPVYEFAPLRSGWNGWLFQAGIVTGTGVSKKSGKPMVRVEYPGRGYAQTMRNMRGEECGLGERKTLEKWFNAECVFEFDMFRCNEQMKHPREYWCGGCYDVDTEFLIDRGILNA